jgi:hypothetical protein
MNRYGVEEMGAKNACCAALLICHFGKQTEGPGVPSWDEAVVQDGMMLTTIDGGSLFLFSSPLQ